VPIALPTGTVVVYTARERPACCAVALGSGALHLDLLLGLAPALILAVGLVPVVLLTAGRSSGVSAIDVGQRIATATILLALIAAGRSWVDRRGPADITFLARLAGDSEVQLPGLLLQTVRLDLIAMLGLTTCLGLGLLAIGQSIESDQPRRTTPALILFLTFLGILLAMSSDVASFAAMWLALTLTLAALARRSVVATPEATAGTTALGEMMPSGDARRWLRLALVGAPVFWVAGCALFAVSGSASLVAARPVPATVVVGLILIGVVVAGIAPFASRRLLHHRHPEIALVVDGVLPVVGVILAARSIGLVADRRSLLPLAVLVLIGLSGIASAALALQRGRGIGDAGRLEGSLAFLVLAFPTAFGPPVGVLVVGVGTIVRAIQRLPQRDRFNWLRVPSAIRNPSFAARTREPIGGGTSSRSRALTLDRRIADLVLPLAETLARVVRLAEQRYDLAIGLIFALATIFIFYG
jgi:hypothetical protein